MKNHIDLHFFIFGKENCRNFIFLAQDFANLHGKRRQGMEVELLWRRTNAPSVALREGLRFLRLAEFVRYNRAAIGGPLKRQPMKSLTKLSHNPPRSSSWCIGKHFSIMHHRYSQSSMLLKHTANSPILDWCCMLQHATRYFKVSHLLALVECWYCYND